MDKSLFVYILIGLVFAYLITNFIGGIQEEDERYRNNAYNEKHRYSKYQEVDSVGRPVLNLIGVDAKIQIGAWNSSTLKDEYMNEFPDFSAMKAFIKERIKGDVLKAKIRKNIDDVEGKYLSGTMSADQAKQALDSIK